MRKIGFKKFLTIAIIVTLVSVVSYGSTVLAYGGWDWIHAGVDSVPMPMHCWSGLSDLTKNDINNACYEWNNTGGCGTLIQKSTDTSNNTYNDSNGTSEITRNSLGLNGVVAICHSHTNIFLRCVEADINFNTSYPFTNSVQPDCFTVQAVATHELGHVLGLADIYDSAYDDVTMYHESILYDDSQSYIEAEDIEGLHFIYDE